MTAEYLPSALKKHVDIESRHKTDSSAMGKSLIDLFASRVPHQLSIYVAWRKDSYSAARNTFSITWNKEFYYAFPSFYLIAQVLNQIKKDKTKKNNSDNIMLADSIVVPPNIEHVDKETSNPSII